jgi:hypothetical protein
VVPSPRHFARYQWRRRQGMPSLSDYDEVFTWWVWRKSSVSITLRYPVCDMRREWLSTRQRDAASRPGIGKRRSGVTVKRRTRFTIRIIPISNTTTCQHNDKVIRGATANSARSRSRSAKALTQGEANQTRYFPKADSKIHCWS